MPKAILEFNLPEELDEYTLAISGNNLYYVLWDLDQHLRAIHKYNADKLSPEILDFAWKLREKLRNIMNDKNVSLEMVS